MKLLVFVFFLILMPVMILAQSAKLKWLFNINYGVSNYIGNGANHNTYMNGTIPVENDYSQNPFGHGKASGRCGVGSESIEGDVLPGVADVRVGFELF